MKPSFSWLIVMGREPSDFKLITSEHITFTYKRLNRIMPLHRIALLCVMKLVLEHDEIHQEQLRSTGRLRHWATRLQCTSLE
jgi:hypothetical protein